MAGSEPHLVRVRGRRKFYIAWTEEIAPGRYRTRRRSTGCEDQEEARIILDAFIDRQAQEADAEGCQDLIDRYLTQRRDVMDYPRLEEAAVPLKAHFGKTPATKITEAQCRRYSRRTKRSKGGGVVSNGTARRELGMLRAALRLAGYETNIWLPPRSTPRDRFLTIKEAERLIAGAAMQHVSLFIMIGLSTGARKTSILELTWDRVDLDNLVIDFNEPGRPVTNKRRAAVPISQQLAAALRDAKQFSRTGYVIEMHGKPMADIKHGFARAAGRAELSWCTPHHLKHTAISWFAEDGWSDSFIAELTETDIETVKRIYRKVRPDYLRPMAESQARRVFSSGAHSVRSEMGKNSTRKSKMATI